MDFNEIEQELQKEIDNENIYYANNKVIKTAEQVKFLKWTQDSKNFESKIINNGWKEKFVNHAQLTKTFERNCISQATRQNYKIYLNFKNDSNLVYLEFYYNINSHDYNIDVTTNRQNYENGLLNFLYFLDHMDFYNLQKELIYTDLKLEE